MGGQGARRAARIIITRRSQAMIQLDTGSVIRALVRHTPQDIEFRSWLRSRPGAGISRGLIAISVLS